MDDEIRHRMLSRPAFRMLRWTVPWIALGLLLLAIGGLASEFRKASGGGEGSATSTVDATGSVTPTKTAETPKTAETTAPEQPAQTQTQQPVTPGKATVAVALVEGILLRKSPSPSGEVMDRLKDGTEMAVLETTDEWLRVKDPLGREGWIRNNENLVSLKQK